MKSHAQPLQTSDTPLLPGIFVSTAQSGDITGTIDKILFADIDSGFSILRVRTDDGKLVIVRGKGDPASIGDHIAADGDWIVDAKWGRQFKAKLIRTEIPESTSGIVRYLSSGAISGVGKRAAEKLQKHFGDQLPQVINAPSTLMSAGIPERKAYAISDHWLLRTRYAKLVTLLMSHGIGTATAQKIIQKYGDMTMSVVLREPYRLPRDIHGVGFKKADLIALSQSLPKDSSERIKAGIDHQIKVFQRDGHCAAGRAMLSQEVAKLISLSTGLVEREIDAMITTGDLVQATIGTRTVVYDRAIYDCEVEVADEIVRRIVSNPLPANANQIIADASTKLGISLHENQHDAVRMALAESLMVLTGGPGCGKTSTVQTMIEAMLTINPELRITLAAPTGRAAKRMSESTGLPAKTIHRMLAWSADGRGFLYGKDKKLETDMLIVDEGSMQDVWMMRDVLRALPENARLVIVGDADQLPSVGPGNVLLDLIESGVIPVVRLTKVFRQGAGSTIATAAKQINERNLPSTSKPNVSADMWGVFVDDPLDVVDKVRRIVTQVTEHLGYDPLRDIQVLTPGHGYETGTTNLNTVLQDTLNARGAVGTYLPYKDREFRVGDRVIQTSNNYDLDVFNGDIGNVLAVHDQGEEGAITVAFDDGEVIYSRSDLDQLQLAYAISIHKSQGSEFPVVIVVLTTQHYLMLRKNLVYTGVSRAKKLCAIVGNMRALRTAIQSEQKGRLTGLAQKLTNGFMAREWTEPCAVA